jgi:hypothetical protein
MYNLKVLIGHHVCYGSWDSSVSTVTDYRLDVLSSIPGKAKGYSSTPQCPYQLWCPPSLLSGGYQGSFPRSKVAGGEDDHPHLSSAKVTNDRAIPLLAHMSS